MPHKPPLGYLNNKYQETGKSPIFKDPIRFPILQKCWQILIEKRISVEALRTIAHDLGLRMPSGNKIIKSQFHAIFRNPFYYGHFLWNDAPYEGKLKSKPRYRTFAYTGLIRCGECGAAITAEKKIKTQKNGNMHHYTYYRCTKQMHPTCTQKTIREEALEKQVSAILGSIEIPERFHQWAINCLKEESHKDQDDRNAIIQGHQDNLSLCNRKLETVVSMRINQELPHFREPNLAC